MILDTFDSPLGTITLCSDGITLSAVTFEGQKHEQTHIPQDATAGSCAVLEETKLWLSVYFEGNIPDFLPPLSPKGTAFQQKVWKRLLQIPYGQTISYGDLAKDLGCKSAQAIGGAVGRNPISILIPCHRVVGSSGKLTGYAGGISKKDTLLKIENSQK